MNTGTLHSMCLAGSMVAVISLSACTGSSHKTRADMAQAELNALQQAFGEEELTPDAITALRTMITALMGRAEITPEALQALRDQVDSLMGRADISPEALQALRDQVDSLMSRADISPEALQALRDQVDSLMGRADISPEALQALRDQVDSLMGHADITPEALQALRDQVDSLMGRADISPEALQALRDQVDSLMGRADISPEALQALRDQVDSLMSRMEALFAATVPEGLTRSTAPPVEVQNASDTLATLLPDPANLFAPLAALFGGDSGDQSPGSELASDLRVKTVSSDGNDGFRVTYVAGGEEQTIHFEAADYLDGQWYYAKVVDGVTYFLATHTRSFERASRNQGPSGYRYFDLNQFGISDEDAGTIERNYMSYGARTDTSGLPAGEATYVGSVETYTYLEDDPSTAQRERMRSGIRLTADFDAGTLDGLILGIRVRRPGEKRRFALVRHHLVRDRQWEDRGRPVRSHPHRHGFECRRPDGQHRPGIRGRHSRRVLRTCRGRGRRGAECKPLRPRDGRDVRRRRGRTRMVRPVWSRARRLLSSMRGTPKTTTSEDR